MGWLSEFFTGKKEEVKPQLIETPEQKRMLSYLYNMPESYGQIEPLLQQYINQPQSQLVGLGAGEIEKTLTGDYDPYTSPYYQSLRRGLDIEKERGMTSLRQTAQQSGMYESLGRLINEARLTGQDVGAAGDILAGLQYQERQNRLEVLPEAMQYGQYQENAPIRKLSAIGSYANIPSQQAGQALQSYTPSYYYPTYSQQPSYLSQALKYGKDIADIYATFATGGLSKVAQGVGSAVSNATSGRDRLNFASIGSPWGTNY